MKSIIENLFHSAIEFQFREPITQTDDNDLFDNSKLIDEMETTDEKDAILIDFSRPSDFRLKAFLAKKSGFNASGDDSHLESSLLQSSSSKTTISTENSAETKSQVIECIKKISF